MITIPYPPNLRQGIPGVSDRMHTLNAWGLLRTLAKAGLTEDELKQLIVKAEQLHDRQRMGDRTRGPWMRPVDYFRALGELPQIANHMAWKLRSLS